MQDAAHAGCSLARVNILAEAPEASPFWSDIPFDFQRMRTEQLSYFSARFVDGWVPLGTLFLHVLSLRWVLTVTSQSGVEQQNPNPRGLFP